MSMSEIQQAIQDADAKFSKMARELESLRQENSRLRERIIKRDYIIAEIHNHAWDASCPCKVCAMWTEEIPNPPKRS